MIKRVTLENWRTHAKSVFEFENGTNVLVGAMGSGKSSIMDAICFALFGTFPALQSKRVSLEEIITSKPNKEEFAKVSVEFFYNEKNFAVERIIKRKGTNEAKLHCENKLLAGPKSTDVTRAIEQALEINYNLFSRAVYSEQNQIDFFLRLSPLERKEQFDELLDLKKYEQARGNAVKISNSLKDLLAERKDWLEKQKKVFDEKELSELGKKISAKKKAVSEAEEKIAGTKKEIEKLREKETELEKKEKEFHRAKEELLAMQAEIRETKKTIEETKKSLKGKTGTALEKELHEKEKEIEKILGEKSKNDSEIKELMQEANALVKEQGLNEEKISRIEKSIHELKHAKADCPVCKKPLDENAKKSLLGENTAEKEEIALKEKELLGKMKKAKEEIDKKNSLKEKLEEKREKEKEALLEMKGLLKEFEAIEKKEKSLSETEKNAEKAEKELEKTGFEESELKKNQKQLIEEKSLLESLEREKRNDNERIGELSQDLKKAEDVKKQLLELEEKIKKSEKAREKIILFTNSLKATQAELREMLVENINLAMNDIWQKIYPYGDFSSARLEIEQGSYELKVKDRNGNWTRVEGILSGGERSAAALCIRIAFSLVLTQNLSLLILDEPTHNLDAHSVSVLSKTMREQLPELVEQIFIITHDREMEKAASASIYALQRDKGNDGATMPEKLEIM